MLYFDVKMKYELNNSDDEKGLVNELCHINRQNRRSSKKDGKLLFYSRSEGVLNALLIIDCEETSLTQAKKDFESEMNKKFKKLFKSVRFVTTSPREITIEEACGLIDVGCLKEYFDGYTNADSICEAEYMDNSYVKYDESVLEQKTTTYSEAVDEAHRLLADDSFFEELERIYSPLNKHKFYGNPVHYKINAASRETAKHIVDLLARALLSNRRLMSSRVTYVTDTNPNGRRSDFDDLCDNSYASLVAVECADNDAENDNYARDAQIRSENIKENIKEYSSRVLFVLVDIGGGNKICKHCIGELTAKDIDFIEIGEGRGGAKTAKSYLARLLKENHIPYAKEDFVLQKQEDYSVIDIVKAYNQIKSGSIKNSIYKAYKDCKKLEVEKPENFSNSYDKLQKMVGLTEIKSIIDQIISAQKMNKLRRNMGLEAADTAKHMIFTGNPGSAKTTVARLLASILYDEHVIDNNKFIECGRQDLVGMYVGWTAKQVEAKFREAKGGVLFIDEAYSLVEQGGYYGDEAINTIVQMMENYRDDVIVIFAGYPDKMKKFLEKNEGLRSRIAFHIDFPDYNGEELCDILKLMTKDKGYTLDEEAEEKCRGIFEIACKNAEFGNGRFVRNVLEQAIIKQSSRIVSEYSGDKVDKKVISLLSAADFDINAASTYKSPKVAIGF